MTERDIFGKPLLVRIIRSAETPEHSRYETDHEWFKTFEIVFTIPSNPSHIAAVVDDCIATKKREGWHLHSTFAIGQVVYLVMVRTVDGGD